MQLKIGARWHNEGRDLDARLLPLLRAVAKTGSLNQAVAALRMSYRHAWGLLGNVERVLGQSLVVLERGRGAHLSPLAEKLLAADEAAAEFLNREFGETLLAMNRETGGTGQPGKPLIVHASHDLALIRLRDLLSRTGNAAIDLHFKGSLESLASLARRDCDIAGFHVPGPGADGTALSPYRPWLKARSLRLVRFVHRQQGLMVARGNPKGVLSLADLVEKDVRFINRQPGSGTRLCLDRLLVEANLQAGHIKGYQLEEFTHAAVAATVASGMADAALGIEAAASQAGLDFVPIVTERYFLAAHSSTLSKAPAEALLAILNSAAFHECWQGLPGYEAPGAGEIVRASSVLSAIDSN